MDLKTRYLGLNLKNPVVPSASPMTEELDGLKRLEDAGAAAVVLPSLFEEQIESEARSLHHYLESGSESSPEAMTYLPDIEFHAGPDDYLEKVRRAKDALSIPVIASLNGSTPGGWTDYASKIEQAGADALELNLYRICGDARVSGGAVEADAVAAAAQVRGGIKIPLAVKIAPYYSSVGHIAAQFVEAGANGLVLFNRFYQADIDLETLEVRPNLVLSTAQAIRLPLTWIALLHKRVNVSLAASSGIRDHHDVLKVVMAGADVAMMAAELLRRGPGHIATVLAGLTAWMEKREYASIRQMHGSMSQISSPDPTAFERAQYIKTVTGYHVQP
ncbi:MAG: dihydroorotate dehydrogenase [Elusimicrobia bacterium CG1_02_63_36]|nr:MAG: dihydroorotate dehydrogenase [Elusimicrobia bacterium CG1_02_63_36]PIP83395.1 MAG: dihydroorotate dehydrogenase [Elusimicrobia bacterium CG22_combo_CG10-13_8_21_14_all_63_91]PJA11643.1 MAG: dihydroorotate dehydrogenase [Elusimicrobia bacterium CG_4_10_14_0_2_um_filter_63_34]PJB23056.1 MAG: dihydroorotate dehydrogenase [Elusimicrobia bacterium CG_4_9_14_3_um_filter_62_55]